MFFTFFQIEEGTSGELAARSSICFSIASIEALSGAPSASAKTIITSSLWRNEA
jgi:hypothetical protein